VKRGLGEQGPWIGLDCVCGWQVRKLDFDFEWPSEGPLDCHQQIRRILEHDLEIQHDDSDRDCGIQILLLYSGILFHIFLVCTNGLD
jgi:hypothetical protein